MKLKKPGGLFRESAGVIEPGHSLNTPCLVSLQSHSPVVRAAEQIFKKIPTAELGSRVIC